jgi:hypothetical protein
MTDDRSNGDTASANANPWSGTGSFAGNPSEQITQSLKSVSEALKSAGERVASTSQEVGLCAIRQAEQNTQQLFDTLRAMAGTSSPREVTELYTRFVSESAKSHAAQLQGGVDTDHRRSRQGADAEVTRPCRGPLEKSGRRHRLRPVPFPASRSARAGAAARFHPVRARGRPRNSPSDRANRRTPAPAGGNDRPAPHRTGRQSQ